MHHHPGRLRLRADALRGAAGTALLEKIVEAVRLLAGIVRVAGSAQTGSVLVEYEPGQVEPGMILAAAVNAAGFPGVVDEEALRLGASNTAVNVVRALSRADAATSALSAGRADLRLLVPAALLVGSAFSLLRRPVLPRWDNLLYWSYTLFRDLNAGAFERVARERAAEDESEDSE